MQTKTLTIDSQVHAYERDRPERPWSGSLQGPDEKYQGHAFTDDRGAT